MVVYHGSDHIIQEPRYLGGKPDNDYGNGFYTTEYEDRARSWATLNGNPEKSIVNVYDLNIEDLQVLDLNECGVLAWIAEVVGNRGTSQEAARITGNRIVELYRTDSTQHDIIKGYRADDSYTQVVEAFLLNQINVHEVERLFYKGSLGNQVFLKSEKAFNTEGMKMPAYDECYLNSMIQKNRYLFKLIARNCEDVFQIIADYMNGEYRRYMDMGNPLYLNKTPKQILGSLGIPVVEYERISEKYDEFILEWMADIYIYMQWKYNMESAILAERIKPAELYAKYYPLHEASLENGAEKLKEIYM